MNLFSPMDDAISRMRQTIDRLPRSICLIGQSCETLNDAVTNKSKLSPLESKNKVVKITKDCSEDLSDIKIDSGDLSIFIDQGVTWSIKGSLSFPGSLYIWGPGTVKYTTETVLFNVKCLEIFQVAILADGKICGDDTVMKQTGGSVSVSSIYRGSSNGKIANTVISGIRLILNCKKPIICGGKYSDCLSFSEVVVEGSGCPLMWLSSNQTMNNIIWIKGESLELYMRGDISMIKNTCEGELVLNIEDCNAHGLQSSKLEVMTDSHLKNTKVDKLTVTGSNIRMSNLETRSISFISGERIQLSNFRVTEHMYVGIGTNGLTLTNGIFDTHGDVEIPSPEATLIGCHFITPGAVIFANGNYQTYQGCNIGSPGGVGGRIVFGERTQGGIVSDCRVNSPVDGPVKTLDSSLW